MSTKYTRITVSPDIGEALQVGAKAPFVVNLSQSISGVTIEELTKVSSEVKKDALSASNSAKAAKVSETNAKDSADSAKSQADLAKEQVVLATEQVEEAKNQVGLAKEQVVLATEQVVEAKNQVDLAKEQVGLATEQVVEAKNQVGLATEQVSKAKDQVGLAKEQVVLATEQANVAANQALEATTQASLAKASSDEATTQAALATTKADEAKASAESSSTSAIESKNSATEADNSAKLAKQNSQDAKVSADAAKVSETNAKGSADSAESSLNEIKSHTYDKGTIDSKLREKVNKSGDVMDGSLITKGYLKSEGGEVNASEGGNSIAIVVQNGVQQIVTKTGGSGYVRNTLPDHNGKLLSEGDYGIGGIQSLGDRNLNDVKIPGDYQQDRSSNATKENNYPINTAGYLNVKQTVNGWGNGCIQQYHMYAGVGYFQRTWNGSDWSSWDRFVSEKSPLITSIQGDIGNKADLSVIAEQTFRGIINASRVCAQQNDYKYMLGVRAGQAFLDYWDGKQWTGEVLHPQRPGMMMLVNDYGMNVSGNIKVADFNNLKGFGWHNQPATVDAGKSLNHPTKRAGNLTVWRGAGQSSCIQHWMDYYTAEALSRTYYSYEDKWSRWYKTYGEQNTTVDPQGFIKKASPIVNINPNGTFTTNDESEGATVTRVAQGEYLIEGVLGFNSDAGWGGVDGGIEIPLDVNKQPLIWVDSKVMEDGSILVRTYHRTHPNAPKFASNDIDGYKDGDPIDIPDGRFISVRVQMPEQSIYNVRMREMEEDSIRYEKYQKPIEEAWENKPEYINDAMDKFLNI